MKTQIKKHYHWLIAVILFINLTIHGGFANNSGLFLLPVTGGLDISRGEFSLAISCRSLVGFFSLLFSGVFVTRLGNQKMMIVGLCLGCAGYLLASGSQNLGFLAVAHIILGICDGLGSTTTVSRIVCDWFHRFQGAILGITSAATGLGGTLICFLLTNLITTSGWRTGYLAAALLFLFSCILVVLFIRSRPSDIGLQPYGFGYVSKKAKTKSAQTHWEGYTMKQLVRRPAFYLMLLVTFLSATCIYLMFSVVVPHVQDRGLSAADASTLQGSMLTLLAVSKILCGILSDRIGAMRVTVLCMLCAVVSLWMMADVSSLPSAWITIIIYSFALPLAAIVPPLLTHAIFGYQSYNKCIGIITAMTSLGSLVANPISNLSFDLLGSYSPVFRVGAIISLVVIGLYLLLFALAKKDRKKFDAAAEVTK